MTQHEKLGFTKRFLQLLGLVFFTSASFVQNRNLLSAQEASKLNSNALCKLEVRSYEPPVSGHESLWLLGSGLRILEKNDVEVQLSGRDEKPKVVPVLKIEHECTPASCIVEVNAQDVSTVSRVRARCSTNGWSAWQTVH